MPKHEGDMELTSAQIQSLTVRCAEITRKQAELTLELARVREQLIRFEFGPGAAVNPDRIGPVCW